METTTHRPNCREQRFARPSDGFTLKFTAPSDPDWVRRCMDSVRAHLEEYCFVNPPETDIAIEIARSFGPRRSKR